MFGVDLYGRVRLAVLGQGLSQREASRRFGIDRGTVAKMVSHSAPPGYRRSVEPRRLKLDRHSGFTDQILSDDLSAPKNQHHTIQGIYASEFTIAGAMRAALTAATARGCATLDGQPVTGTAHADYHPASPGGVARPA